MESTTSGDCTQCRVCHPFYTRLCPPATHKEGLFSCTVTCRQFRNMTFAPRNSPPQGRQPHASQLSCHSLSRITQAKKDGKYFFTKIPAKFRRFADFDIRVKSRLPRQVYLPVGIRLYDPPHMEREAMLKAARECGMWGAKRQWRLFGTDRRGA